MRSTIAIYPEIVRLPEDLVQTMVILRGSRGHMEYRFARRAEKWGMITLIMNAIFRNSGTSYCNSQETSGLVLVDPPSQVGPGTRLGVTDREMNLASKVLRKEEILLLRSAVLHDRGSDAIDRQHGHGCARLHRFIEENELVHNGAV